MDSFFRQEPSQATAPYNRHENGPQSQQGGRASRSSSQYSVPRAQSGPSIQRVSQYDQQSGIILKQPPTVDDIIINFGKLKRQMKFLDQDSLVQLLSSVDGRLWDAILGMLKCFPVSVFHKMDDHALEGLFNRLPPELVAGICEDLFEERMKNPYPMLEQSGYRLRKDRQREVQTVAEAKTFQNLAKFIPEWVDWIKYATAQGWRVLLIGQNLYDLHDKENNTTQYYSRYSERHVINVLLVVFRPEIEPGTPPVVEHPERANVEYPELGDQSWTLVGPLVNSRRIQVLLPGTSEDLGIVLMPGHPICSFTDSLLVLPSLSERTLPVKEQMVRTAYVDLTSQKHTIRAIHSIPDEDFNTEPLFARLFLDKQQVAKITRPGHVKLCYTYGFGQQSNQQDYITHGESFRKCASGCFYI